MTLEESRRQLAKVVEGGPGSGPHKGMPKVQGDVAHKGYLIKYNSLTGQHSIQKDGQHIAYAASQEHAKATIDQLVD